MPLSARFHRSATSYLKRTTGLPPTSTFTMMAWVRENANGYSSGAGVLYGFVASGTSGCYMGWQNGTGLDMTSADMNDFTYAASLGLWYHTAITASGTDAFGYVNGVLRMNGAAGRIVEGDTLVVGASSNGVRYSASNVAALKIWNRELSQAEIVAEMPYALPVNRAGLNSCYPIPSGWDVLAVRALGPLDGLGGALTRWGDWSGGGLEWTEADVIDLENGPPIQFSPIPAYRRRGKAAGAAAAVYAAYYQQYYRREVLAA